MFGRWRWVGVVVLVLWCAVATPAGAQTLTFNAHPTSGATAQFEGAYKFVFAAEGWGILADDLSTSWVRNGTTRLTAAGDGDLGTARVKISRTDGQPFSLIGFDAATQFLGFNGQIEVVGNLQGGGTVSTTLDVADSFAAYLLPATFTGLANVSVRDTASGPFEATPGFSLDNLEVSHTEVDPDPVPGPAVPEPSAVLLFLPACAVANLFRRRSG